MFIFAKPPIPQEVASILLKIKAVTFRFDPPYTYTSGLKAPIYIDNRLVMSYPEYRTKVISYYIEAIKEYIGMDNIDCISATATAAIPHGAWIADKLNLPMVYVRTAKKGHGKENRVEGYLKEGSRVLIVEDHLSTAKSSIENAEAIRELGGKVDYIVASTTYETQKSTDELTNHHLKAIVLSTFKIIVDQAAHEDFLDKEEKALVEDWLDDPPGWAERHGK